MFMFCQNCGEKATGNFCGNCGNPINFVYEKNKLRIPVWAWILIGIISLPIVFMVIGFVIAIIIAVVMPIVG